VLFSLVAIWGFVNTNWQLTPVLSAVLALVALIELARYVESVNRELAAFLEFVTHDDFSSSFPIGGKGRVFHRLETAYRRLLAKYRGLNQARELNHRYLESLVGLEKGYAAYTGRNDQSKAWEARAKGWISVMKLDALIAMCVYTTVTAAFYLLGAAVLHSKGHVPEGYAMVETLSAMYTESLGPQARVAFLIGAFITLFSTLFAALAAWTRQVTDIFGQLQWIQFDDRAIRKRTIAILAWVIPLLWASLFVFIRLPVLMVITGGIVGSFLLFLVVFAVIQFRYKRLLTNFKPGFFYDLILWISILSILGVGIFGIIKWIG
jgi:Mn2+/Fe2+ NRAMP family transporter